MRVESFSNRGSRGEILDVGEHPRDQKLDVRSLPPTTVASLIMNLDETVTKN
jgi:hypothetical protein